VRTALQRCEQVASRLLTSYPLSSSRTNPRHRYTFAWDVLMDWGFRPWSALYWLRYTISTQASAAQGGGDRRWSHGSDASFTVGTRTPTRLDPPSAARRLSGSPAKRVDSIGGSAVPCRFVYPSAFYYFAFLTNAAARLSWAIYISPGQTVVQQHVILVLGCVELLRRAQWALLRLEWEQ
jgi:hypothetical protein